jgi:hypothetical protein
MPADRHLQTGEDDGDDNDNDRDLRLGRHRLFDTRTTEKMKKKCSTLFPRRTAGAGLKWSLARPFDDLCRRDHVFLVVVVFEFEFVVCSSGVLNRVSKRFGRAS